MPPIPPDRPYPFPHYPTPLAKPTADADSIAMNTPSVTRSPWRALFVPVLVAVAFSWLLTINCGLSESEWRRELEPFLPEGVTIVHSKTGNCTIEPNCSVSFELEHDRSRYVEDVVAFVSAMEAEGWTKVGEGEDVDSAGVQFERRDIRVSLRLLSTSWRERCVETRGGADDPTCKSTLVVQN